MTHQEVLISEPPTDAAADLAAFYDRYAPALFGIAMRTTGSHAQAEQLLAGTLERFWRERHGYDRSKGRLLPYVMAKMRVLATEQGFGKEHSIRGSGLHAFAQELPGDLSAVYSACLVDGATDEVAAQALGLSVEEVRQRSRAALRSLVLRVRSTNTADGSARST